MNDDPVRAHLRAALEVIARREEARLRAVFDDVDRSTAEQTAAMRPVITFLTTLQEEVGARDDVRFVLPGRTPVATVEAGTVTASHRIRLTFDVDLKSYRLERTDTWCFADGGSRDTVIHAPSPKAAVKHVVELIGEHLGAERALQVFTRRS
jgi:hypothetical protein